MQQKSNQEGSKSAKKAFFLTETKKMSLLLTRKKVIPIGFL